MKIEPEQVDAIAWLNEAIKEYANNHTSDKNDMQQRLMQIAAMSYAIELVLEKVN